VVGENLDAGPDDEQHEEHVPEMLELKPQGKPVSTDGAVCAMPR
jgi:hypothetical protein